MKIIMNDDLIVPVRAKRPKHVVSSHNWSALRTWQGAFIIPEEEPNDDANY